MSTSDMPGYTRRLFSSSEQSPRFVLRFLIATDTGGDAHRLAIFFVTMEAAGNAFPPWQSVGGLFVPWLCLQERLDSHFQSSNTVFKVIAEAGHDVLLSVTPGAGRKLRLQQWTAYAGSSTR
jgi:hypothetical protein